MIDMIQTISFADDPEDRKDGILEVGGEEVSADEADPDYTEYMTGDFNKSMKISITAITTLIMVTVWMFRKKDPCWWNTRP